MTQSGPRDQTSGAGDKLPGFDTSVANPARMWNYWVGGKDNFADRQAAEKVMEVMPSMPLIARLARRFLIDAVYQLAAGEGIRQFLDIGTARAVTAGYARRIAPGSALVISCASYDDDALAKRLAAEYTAGPFVNHTRRTSRRSSPAWNWSGRVSAKRTPGGRGSPNRCCAAATATCWPAWDASPHLTARTLAGRA